MDSEKEHLTALGQHVHDALRMVKIGEVGTISCGKTFPVEEVRSYVWGYSFHKKKWFVLREDKVSGVLFAERTEPPKPQRYREAEEVE